ncbi:hypothetical protein A3J15_00820 [Candidatus Roizmanbacteria bacterium RIFCSPLOWO2_02_FULL_38_10]|uniref:Nudix hydrolase domain-containing protein n=1 Tax=Candidatus Roizmanbacteria bacterium RIFCSPLOWO2_02_FULL_38_10 TaxID=1802074 RepID=A0A1F7JMV2_9BACT|nr:MAG: hypothetical protein A3J15_00820 [Candidatus Roizmanbacteria bacterium RIFCSPLOWO2_02_FULL_38_10]
MIHEISAGGIVFRKFQISNFQFQIKWLICQHSQHKGWVFPKGLVGDKKRDEPLEEAALREVEEEGGIKAKLISPLPKPVEYYYLYKGDKIKKTVHYFLMEYISGDPKNHDFEMVDAKFIPKNDVRKTLTYLTDKEAFEEAIKLMINRY